MNGPRILAIPGSSKTFDQFRADDFDCRKYASSQVGGITPNQAVNDSAIRSAAVGAAGAIINGGNGAAVGADAGVLLGALTGMGAGEWSAHTFQQRYDYAYTQCIYAKGEKVAVTGHFVAVPAECALTGFCHMIIPSALQLVRINCEDYRHV